ncbi:MAG: NAD-dependent epimerase/dehydratase family protein [Polyangiales bacterium]
MRVLVTGGTGFLGGHIALELQNGGHEPIVFARSSSNTAALEARGVEIRRGAFDNPSSLRAACEGVDAVVHAAGGGVVREVADYYRSNSESTEALLASLRGDTHFVLISSLAAHGPALRTRAGFDTPVAFADDADAPTSHYGKSKLRAERACLDSKVPCTILRPPALYGAGEYRMVPLFRLAQRGVVPTVHPKGTLSLLSGRDCARAVVCSLEGAHEGLFYVSEPRPITRHAMAKAIARFAGHSRVLAIPQSVVLGAGRVSEALSAARGKRAMFNRDKAADICAPHQSCDPAHAESTLEWQAEDRFVDSTRGIGLAYQDKGWLP